MQRPDRWLLGLLRQRRFLALLLGFAVIEAAYVFFVSAGRLTHWPTYLTFLDDMAEGFRGGHLHMAVEPRAALLAKADPFDPAWKPLWYWDASLYGGHYYLYWGPVPALLLAGWKAVFRVRAHLGDQYVVFALASVQALAGLALIDRAQRRLFPAVPGVLVALAVAVFAFANPTPYNLARAGVYEAAIVGGQAFLVAGMLFAFDAVSVLGRQRSRLALAGACWALGLGCRVSSAPAVALLVVATCWIVAPRTANRWRLRALALAWAGTPIAIAVVLLLAYNRLRFDAWFDFGRHYQLTWIPFSSSAAFVPANAWSYALRPGVVTCTFPYLHAITGMGARGLPGWLPRSDAYVVFEPVIGCLLAIPWAWLAPAAAVAAVRRTWTLARGPREADAGPGSPALALTWFGAATTLAALGGFIVPLSLFWATMRFLGDAAPVLTLAGTLGWWLCYARVRERPAVRRGVLAAAAVLALATVAAGAALGVEGQYGHFRQHNPALLDQLTRHLSACRTSG